MLHDYCNSYEDGTEMLAILLPFEAAVENPTIDSWQQQFQRDSGGFNIITTCSMNTAINVIRQCEL